MITLDLSIPKFDLQEGGLILRMHQFVRDLVAGSVTDLPAYMEATFGAIGAKSRNWYGVSVEQWRNHPASEIEAQELFLDFISNLPASEWTEDYRRYIGERAHDSRFVAALAKGLAKKKTGDQGRQPVFSRSQEFLIGNWSLFYFLAEGEFKAELSWKRLPGLQFWKPKAVIDLMVAMGFSDMEIFEPSLKKKCTRMMMTFKRPPFVHAVQVVGKSGKVSSRPDHIRLTVQSDPRTLELSSYF